MEPSSFPSITGTITFIVGEKIVTSAVPDAEVLNITETIHAAYGIPTSDRRRRLQSAGLVRTFFTYASVGTIQLEASETLDAVALANHLGIHQR